MEPFIIKSKTNTKIKTILWGIFFILFGIVLEIGMIILCLEEGFSIGYILALLIFSILICAGYCSIHMRKYPLVLLADNKGIHYFVYSSRLGYNKKEIVLPWIEVFGVKQYCEESLSVKYNAIQIDDKNGESIIIFLDDTKVLSINDVVLKLNKLWEYYTNEDN